MALILGDMTQVYSTFVLSTNILFLAIFTKICQNRTLDNFLIACPNHLLAYRLYSKNALQCTGSVDAAKKTIQSGQILSAFTPKLPS
jgi:hypothetical protein